MTLFEALQGFKNDPDKLGSLYRAITGQGQKELLQNNYAQLMGNNSNTRTPASVEAPIVLPFDPSKRGVK